MPGLVAIHQPNFFPWLGYFDKIRRADAFVFLDAVDYPRSGSSGMGSWTNRVRLDIQGEARWITCPIRRMELGSPISAALIDDRQPWRVKMLKTLDANYRKAPHFAEAMALLEPLIRSPEDRLAEFNIAAITAVAEHLGSGGKPLLRQSSLAYEGHATRLLIALVHTVGGGAYLAGGGAAGYQDDTLFADHNVELILQNFRPLSYGERPGYIPGLSVIDYLMHDGRPLSDAFPWEG